MDYRTLPGFSSGLSTRSPILALDPGGTTGVCALVKDELYVGQLGPDEHHRELFNLVSRGSSLIPTEWYYPYWDTVIYESFQYRNSLTKADLIPVEYIGVIKIGAHVSRTRTQSQTPSMAKKLFDDQKVKALGLWTPGLPHANDAVRHMLYYLVVTLKQESILNRLRRDDGY